VHQLLDWFSGVDESLYIRNAEEVVEILEKSNRTFAVFFNFLFLVFSKEKVYFAKK